MQHQLRMGGTPLFKSIELSGRYGGTVYVKDESRNPFGTFKDRRCAALLDRYHDDPQPILIHITSGNSGYSLGMLARDEEQRTGRKITVVNVVDSTISPAIRAKLETCSIVHSVDLSRGVITRDDMVQLARRVANYSGPESSIHTVEDFGLANGYTRIIDEIAEAGIKPQKIICPIGEGELAVELIKRAAVLWPTGTPLVIGITIPENVLVQNDEFLRKLRRNVADKLVNGYSKFKEFVQRYRQEGKLSTYTVSEAEIMREYSYLNSIGIMCEPSAAAAFAGARYWAPSVTESDPVVIINTGKGVYDSQALDKLFMKRVGSVLKYAAATLVGAALVAGLTLPSFFAYQKQQAMIYSALLTEANFFADSTRRGLPSAEDTENACNFIRMGKGKSCAHVSLPFEFTPKELEFYVHYMRVNMIPDMIGRQMQAEMFDKWSRGLYTCTELGAEYCSTGVRPDLIFH